MCKAHKVYLLQGENETLEESNCAVQQELAAVVLEQGGNNLKNLKSHFMLFQVMSRVMQ